MFVIHFATHGMNNKKMINAKQAIIIHHYKNTKLPEDYNYAEICRNKLIRKIHNIQNGASVAN
jgi:CHAT domain-containing protein